VRSVDGEVCMVRSVHGEVCMVRSVDVRSVDVRSVELGSVELRSVDGKECGEGRRCKKCEERGTRGKICH